MTFRLRIVDGEETAWVQYRCSMCMKWLWSEDTYWVQGMKEPRPKCENCVNPGEKLLK